FRRVLFRSFAHDYEAYSKAHDCPYSNIRDMLEASLSDVLKTRANTFDFRVPEDAIEWMKNEDLVDEFINKVGYRLVPRSLTVPTIIDSNDNIIIESQWENKGWVKYLITDQLGIINIKLPILC